MATNQERAEKAIQELTGTGELGKNAAQAIAQALADAGLLMPDLPGPDGEATALSDDGIVGPMHYWGRGDVEAMRNPHRAGQGAVTVFGKQVKDPETLAHWILAAANHAEQEQDNV